MSDGYARELSVRQTQHWEQQLADAERAAEYALRMLGRLPVNEEIEAPADDFNNTGE